MGIIEILKRGGGIIKDSLPVMIVICAFNLISAVIMLAIIGINPTPDKIAEVTGYMMLVFALMMLVWFFIEGGFFASLLSVLKTGNTVMENFLDNCMKFFLRLLAINIIGGLIVIVAWILGAFLMGMFVAFGGGNNIFFNILAGVIFVLTLILVILISIPLLISQYFVVIEDRGVKESLALGVAFFKKSFWKILLFFIVLGVLVFAVSFIVNFATALLGNIVKGWAAAIVSVLVTSLMNGVIGVFSGASILTLILAGMPQEETPPPAEAA